jgi:3D (Asp-Asp-Asp) domain-containing protein
MDRGSAIVGNHLDLYFDTHEEACEWGMRTVRGYVVEATK